MLEMVDTDYERGREASLVIRPTVDGPAGEYDVVEPPLLGTLDDCCEVWFTGTLSACRAEYPAAPLRQE